MSMAVGPKEQITFSFGENWEAFIDSRFSEERVAAAQKHLLEFLRLPALTGKYFLDAGCGSGLHSLAAVRAGAARVVSLDLDPASVRATRALFEREGSPSHWNIVEGSVLDRDFLQTLDPADIVYSWGVLHHTGRMWEAVEAVATLMNKNALLYIALYLTTPRTPHWLAVKRRYNRAPAWRKRVMEFWHAARHTILPNVVRFRNPLPILRDRTKARGMSYWTDVRDWLGGYPYEDASVEQVLHFGRDRLDLELANISIDPTLVEYLFTTRSPTPTR